MWDVITNILCRTVRVPFATSKQAHIACKALSPDPVLKADQAKLDYSVEDTSLMVVISSLDDRILRVTANNMLENLKTVIECFETFE